MLDNVIDQLEPQKKKYVTLIVLAIARIVLVISTILASLSYLFFVTDNLNFLSSDHIFPAIGQVAVCIPFTIYNYVRVKTEIRGYSNHPNIWPSFIVILICFLFIVGYKILNFYLFALMSVFGFTLFTITAIILLVVIIAELKYLHLHYKSKRLDF